MSGVATGLSSDDIVCSGVRWPRITFKDRQAVTPCDKRSDYEERLAAMCKDTETSRGRVGRSMCRQVIDPRRWEAQCLYGC